MSHRTIFMSVVAMLSSTLLQAQDATQPRQVPTATSKVASPNDAILATWLHVGSTNEVSLSQLAVKQAQNPEVRAFAQKMVDDHNAWSATLQPMTTSTGTMGGKDGTGDRTKDASGDRSKNSTGERTKEGSGERSRDDQDGKNPRTAGDASSMRGNATGGTFDHSALVRDLGKKCLQSETKMLTSKTGAEFDKAYMGMQVASHVRCADMLEVFKTYASPALVPTLEAGQKTIAAHLEHAKTLCKQVEDGVAQGNANGNANGNGNGNGGRDGR